MNETMTPSQMAGTFPKSEPEKFHSCRRQPLPFRRLFGFFKKEPIFADPAL